MVGLAKVDLGAYAVTVLGGGAQLLPLVFGACGGIEPDKARVTLGLPQFPQVSPGSYLLILPKERINRWVACTPIA